MSDTQACCYCGTTADELRPYGPGGKWTCLPCIKADPDAHATAVKVYQAKLLSEGKLTGFVEIGTEAGPQSVSPPGGSR